MVSMANSLKKTKMTLDLFTDIFILLRMKKVLEVEYVIPFIDMKKLIINTKKILLKIKDYHILSAGT